MADQNTEEVVDQPSYLDMSDEEIMAAGAPVAAAVEEEVQKPAVADPVIADPEAAADPEKDPAGDADDGDDATGDQPGAKDPAAADPEKKPEVTDPVDPAPGEKDVKTEKDPKVEETKDPVVVDYKAEYDRLLAPFKANGREVAVKSVDDAISLMQMGANYNKKMAALKPILKLTKQLENNGFMSEEKIGFLIDLGKKDPAAISKLIQDSGLDPMDLDAEKAKTYKQTAYAVDDRVIELDTVLDELQGTPTYNRTLEVSNKWDAASKQVLVSTPQLLKVINSHVATGIYDLISKEIESERMFGRLSGLSDIEAYRQVGDAIQARGGFNHLESNQGKPKPAPVVVTPKPTKEEEDRLKDKRRAASSTKPAAPASAAKEFNPLSMSDEEFSKVASNKFQ